MNNSKILELIEYARKEGCSDIHLTVELPPVFRKNGDIFISNFDYSKKDISDAIISMVDEKNRSQLDNIEDLDFA